MDGQEEVVGVGEDTAATGLRERKRASSRARVVDVALALFAEQGYDAVTVADVCAAADIAPRTFFRYFPAKEDVVVEQVRELADRTTAYLAQTPDGLDPAGALDLVLRRLGVHVVANLPRLQLFSAMVSHATALRTDPALRLADRERELADQLVARGFAPAPPDWRTRLVVARATAAFRVWYADVMTGRVDDPLAHLDEVLSAR